jgi:hypothetical protein
MAFPTARFVQRPAAERHSLRLPTTLAAAMPGPHTEPGSTAVEVQPTVPIGQQC